MNHKIWQFASPAFRLNDLPWRAAGPGPDPKVRLVCDIVLQEQHFRLSAHRVLRPLTAGWSESEGDEYLPCGTDDTLVFDSAACREWLAHWNSLEDDCPEERFDAALASKPSIPNDAKCYELAETHEGLWKFGGDPDDLLEVWLRDGDPYLIWGWPISGSAACHEVTIGAAPVDVGDSTGYPDEYVAEIEGVPCVIFSYPPPPEVAAADDEYDYRSYRDLLEMLDMLGADADGLADVAGQPRHLMIFPLGIRYAEMLERGAALAGIFQHRFEAGDRAHFAINAATEADHLDRALRELMAAIGSRTIARCDDRLVFMTSDESILNALSRAMFQVVSAQNKEKERRYHSFLSLCDGTRWHSDGLGYAKLSRLALTVIEGLSDDSVLAAARGEWQPASTTYRDDPTDRSEVSLPWEVDLPVILRPADMREAEQAHESLLEVVHG